MSRPLVVVGDVLLDSDIEGRADRRTPDADVPVVDIGTRSWRPGGAGLAALLAAPDADEVVLVGGFADDAAGRRLRALLDDRVRVVALPLLGTTVSKERVHAVGPCAPGDSTEAVALLRLDSGNGRLGDTPLTDAARAVLRSAGAILVADYGRGVAAHPELRALITHRTPAIPVVWDPHPHGARPVRGATLVTPNRSEAAAFTPPRNGSGNRSESRIRRMGDDPLPPVAGRTTNWLEFGARARLLARRWSADAVAITLGADGAVLYRRGPFGAESFPVAPELRSPPGWDTCGAGDRFAAAAATGLAAGGSVAMAVRTAVSAAARFVRSGAAASVSVVQDETAASEPASAQVPW
ncbi:hypothetical protein IU501_19495 [Nocardia otitidiscaviarum]|uniref:PfkB family carbohydrate kinase n=1 Tax=Nocardia otitidiscaviarum TaxID=1823 RepID=UPI00069496E9|nr:PfkB family carbohydrate kinase [Nocardia otitidiscaviarum]MBF6135172.1 hypothetical protein [Nocardia otitidiscaviarum]MBF6486994.1 hypothetical protein [Nocardia otitidiscaviarum]